MGCPVLTSTTYNTINYSKFLSNGTGQITVNFEVMGFGRTHGAPYRGYGYVPLRFGGTLLGEWEHNNSNGTERSEKTVQTQIRLL